MSVNLSGGFGGSLVVLMTIWGIGVTIYWMIIAWRAMRAHERLASAVERLPNQGRGDA
jgi:hypothetical protein